MINYAYIVKAASYTPPVIGGIFRRRIRPASLDVELDRASWAPHDNLARASIRLTGRDAEAWQRLAPRDAVRVYGRPATDAPAPPDQPVRLNITRIKRGHMDFLTPTSNTLKAARTHEH